MREIYQKKNILIGKSSKRATQIRDSSGNVIKDEASHLQRWAEYFEELLNAEEPGEVIDFSSYTPAEEIDIAKTHIVAMNWTKPSAVLKK